MVVCLIVLYDIVCSTMRAVLCNFIHSVTTYAILSARMLRKQRWPCSSIRCFASSATSDTEYDVPIEMIRNFSIIAHVDHGKSTLADRLLELTGAIKVNSGKQVLDNLQVEKERGITVKAQTASLSYSYRNRKYLLNLIDTPGHVDFTAEVRRSLAPCQGVVLLVDANDGVQAQTVANYYLARERQLVIIPVINKVDLKNANPEKVQDQLQALFGMDDIDVIKISAKLGIGVDKVLDAIIERIPPPVVSRDKPFRALVFDSWYEKHKGAISLIYVKDGALSVGEHVNFMLLKKSYEIRSISFLRPHAENIKTIYAGQVGAISCNMKSQDSCIGDTLHLRQCFVDPLERFKPPKPMVFAGIYPMDQSQFTSLQAAIDKLALNDSAVAVTMESSVALGRGWRIGFLGLLHMEVFVQRLEQEYGTQPIVTAPAVTYKAKIFGAKNITKYQGDMVTFNNPEHFPDRQIVDEFYEPTIVATIITPVEYMSEIVSLCRHKRGIEKSSKPIGNDRVALQYIMPLSEIIVDFHDSLKSISSGYASFDYENHDYQSSDIVKLDILLNGKIADELSSIVHREKAYQMGKKLCVKLLETIPRQLFEIAIQAVIGSKVIARETLKAYKKDVTAKLYGGDVTRRKKLLAQQAEGKKKMRMIGKISLPRDTFINVLKK
ncbi:translation factor GUF1 homolog, mitochondrial isoform X2 [Odontomachus brunneus]|uniref:translation factor GUF1 homolog, mitochondrial isoform X2 n=2 Tax=Odontomachus brunneus TaxID=486640 RepID=UPI0013F1A390|nr:translation factor GUF1 homolog, mitochondrial isoform X2 [Odontomachus brunneus]